MQLEEGPFFIIKDYRSIVGKAKRDKEKAMKLKQNEFTTHQCIPQDIKDEINQILFQLTQPQKLADENRSKTDQYDEFMDQEAYFYFQRMEQERKMESNNEITDIDQFLSLEEKNQL